MLMVGGLFLVSTAQAPRTQEASFDIPTMRRPVTPSTLPAPTTTATMATTTTQPPIIYGTTPPDGRKNLGGDKHAMNVVPAFGMIVIPKLNLVHPIFEGIDEPAIHWGPSHWPGSATPGGRGNTVFAGHRVTHTRPFLDIDRLVPGDQIIFHLATGTHTYAVTEHLIVGPQALWITEQTADTTVTLFACHPKYSAKQRYVVRGKLISSGPYAPV
jgi:LPXTG-site transpeptidase (sortase) family protein